jgi:hypothetical protein
VPRENEDDRNREETKCDNRAYFHKVQRVHDAPGERSERQPDILTLDR